MKRFTHSAMLMAGAGLFVLSGCVHFHEQPLSAEKGRADFETRSLSAAGLKVFLETNLHQPFAAWPLPIWDFANLTLAAFYFHPDLDEARARWSVAQAGKITAGQRPNPSVNVTPTYDTTTPPPWILGGALDIPVETAGKRGYRIAQAQHLSDAARLDIATAAWQVRSRLRRSMLELYAAGETEALLNRQQAVQADVVKLLEAQLAAGAVSANEVTQARIALNTIRLALHDAERQIAEARVRLADALGLPVTAIDGVNLAFEAFTQSMSAVAPAGVRRQALFNRTDILSALAEYAASQSALQLEVAKQYPDIHLGPGYQLDQTDNKWSLGLTVTLPILNQNQGPIAEADAKRKEVAAHFQSVQARALAEIDQAWAGYQAAIQKSKTAEALLSDLQKRRRTIKAMYDAGEISKLELSSAELELTSSALARLDTVIKTQQALGALEDGLQSPVGISPSLFESSPRDSGTKQRTQR